MRKKTIKHGQFIKRAIFTAIAALSLAQAADAATRAKITAPQPGSTLSGSSVVFKRDSGSGVWAYYLYVGSSQGGNNIYSKSMSYSSATVSNLPTDGRTVYVRLWSYAGSWMYQDYTYSTGSDDGGGGDETVVTLKNGSAVTGISASKGIWKHYKIAIPSGASNLQVSISGSNGDADVYTRWAAKPTTSNYDQRPYKGGSNETISYASPQSGTLFVGIHAYAGYSSLTLKASYQTDDGGDNGSKTFIVSAVNDNLDNADMSILADGLKNLGYTQKVYDTNVSHAKMKSYVESGNSIYYHTGHGSEGLVMTSGSSFTYSDATLKCNHTYWATCLTLAPTEWKNRFGTNAQTLNGYTKVSYDGTDDEVVKSLLTQLGNGKSHQYAWYKANAVQSLLSDRWCVYVKEGSKVVEYSGRTGNNPVSATGAPNWVNLDKNRRVFADPQLTAPVMSSAAALVSLRFERAELVDISILDAFNSTSTTLNKDEAVKLAKRMLRRNSMLPPDAAFEKILPINRTDGSNTETVGYSIYFKRIIDGIDVRGNSIADHICVTVSGDYVSSISMYWPEVSQAAVQNTSETILSAAEALNKAADSISASIKGDGKVFFKDVKTVYGTSGEIESGGTLKPAYEFIEVDGLNIIIDAVTAEIL